MLFRSHPLSPRNVNRWFDARCKRYGVRRITVHDTRRTCGSRLAALDDPGRMLKSAHDSPVRERTVRVKHRFMVSYSCRQFCNGSVLFGSGVMLAGAALG